MPTKVRRILIVDDSAEDSEYTKRLLKKAMNWDWRFAEALRGDRGLDLALDGEPFDCILVDHRLPDMDGTEFLERLRDRLGEPGVATVMISGVGTESVAVRAVKSGAHDYILKRDLKPSLLFQTIENAIAKFHLDLAERKSAQALVESEKLYHGLADAMPQIVWTARPDGHRDYFNRRWYEFAGPAEDERDENWTRTLHPDDIEPGRESWHSALISGEPYEVQSRLREGKSGDYRWHLVRALALRDGEGTIVKWVGSATDVEDYRRLREDLERRVEERTQDLNRSLLDKTTLLQEVHHRVKNNLQIVCSLLSMQIEGLKPGESSGHLNDAHSRVFAMATVHEQLYRSASLSDVDFPEYIRKLSSQLFSAYRVGARVRLDLSIEPIVITLDQAIPCGLILNELVSNSLKHAFRDGRDGTLWISLKTESGRAEIEVSDNGVGLPSDFVLGEGSSLGLKVVQILIRQLRADLVISGEGGTSFKFAWNHVE